MPIQDIIHISAEDKYTVIYMLNQHYISDCSLKDYEEQLIPYGFFRTHRKHLINMYHHRVINGSNIVLSSGISLPISKRKITAYRSWLSSTMLEYLIVSNEKRFFVINIICNRNSVCRENTYFCRVT
ncbi:MAG: LytTR family transcriptional regulator [Lachnospiraceae bacterium]|nr:LytTR family transcriptional regulator [Lachnospiraceae bacterium]